MQVHACTMHGAGPAAAGDSPRLAAYDVIAIDPIDCTSMLSIDTYTNKQIISSFLLDYLFVV